MFLGILLGFFRKWERNPEKEAVPSCKRNSFSSKVKTFFNLRVSAAAFLVCHRNPHHSDSCLTVTLLNTQTSITWCFDTFSVPQCWIGYPNRASFPFAILIYEFCIWDPPQREQQQQQAHSCLSCISRFPQTITFWLINVLTQFQKDGRQIYVAASTLKKCSIRTPEAGWHPIHLVILCYFCPTFNIWGLVESGKTFSACIQAVTSTVSYLLSAQPRAIRFMSMLFQEKQHLEPKTS